MEINKLINLLDTVEDALLYSLETTPCKISKTKINHALGLVRETRTETPSRDDIHFIELSCNELPALIDENTRAYEDSLNQLNALNAHIEESLSILEEVERIAAEYQVEFPVASQDTQVLNQTQSHTCDPVQGRPAEVVKVNQPAVSSAQNHDNQARPDLIDYDDFTVAPVAPSPTKRDLQEPELPGLSITIEKRLLHKGYLQALKHLGRETDPKVIYDSSIFIDNFAFYINSQFSPSMSINSAINAFASSGDALKICGHKKITGDITWEMPRSYVQSSVERAGFSMESDTIERLTKHMVKIFDFSQKASELLKESIVILDNDSIMDLLVDFE